MSDHIEACYANQTSYKSLIHEKGVEGTLHSIGVSGAMNEHYFKIEIDDTVVHDGANNQPSSSFSNSSLRNPANNGLALNFDFDAELNVQIRDEPTRFITPRYWVAYTKNIPQQKAVESESEMESEVKDEFVYDQTEVEVEGETNQKSVLRGREKLTEVKTKKDAYEIEEPIKSDVSFFSRDSKPSIPNQDFNILVRPEGRMSSIRETPIDSNKISDSGTLEVDLMEQLELFEPGEYEVLCDASEFGNIPANFTLVYP